MYCLLDIKGFVDSQMHTTVPVKCHFKMNVKLKTSRLRYILESTEKGWLLHEIGRHILGAMSNLGRSRTLVGG